MNLTAWLKERATREAAYRRAREASEAALERYDHAGGSMRDVYAAIRAMDRAYLAWCETDRWKTEP